jgi:hypothetical protein
LVRWLESQRERDHWLDLGIGVRVILKWILDKQDAVVWIGLICRCRSAYDPEMLYGEVFWRECPSLLNITLRFVSNLYFTKYDRTQLKMSEDNYKKKSLKCSEVGKAKTVCDLGEK